MDTVRTHALQDKERQGAWSNDWAARKPPRPSKGRHSDPNLQWPQLLRKRALKKGREIHKEEEEEAEEEEEEEEEEERERERERESLPLPWAVKGRRGAGPGSPTPSLPWRSAEAASLQLKECEHAEFMFCRKPDHRSCEYLTPGRVSQPCFEL